MTMPTEVTDKMLAAVELLDRGLQMYFDGAYFAALHLAGGAEDVLGGYVTRTGEENAFVSLRTAAVKFSKLLAEDGVAADEEVMGRHMNYARNRTKHLDKTGDDDIHFDPGLQANDMLDRAISNYIQLLNILPLPIPELLQRFSDERMAEIRMEAPVDELN